MLRASKAFVYIALFLAAAVLALVAGAATADTLELRDGTLIEGTYLGGGENTIRFRLTDEVIGFELTDVVALYLSKRGASATQAPPPQTYAPPTVPAGTRLLIRTSETLDSSRQKPGHRFRSQLESNLSVNGQVIAPRGTWVYGVLSEAKKSGRLRGRSELSVAFTDIMIDDTTYPIATTGLKAVSEETAGRTVGTTARAAAIGGLIDGSSGARTGAKVGLGASIVTSGNSVNIPRGTLVEVQLTTPLTIQ